MLESCWTERNSTKGNLIVPCQTDVTYLRRNATLKERTQHRKKGRNTNRRDATQKEGTQHRKKGRNTDRRDATQKEGTQNRKKGRNRNRRDATLKEGTQHWKKGHNTERWDATVKKGTQHWKKGHNNQVFLLLLLRVPNRRHTLMKGHNTERINHKGHNTERINPKGHNTTTKETSIFSGMLSGIWETIQNALTPPRMHHQKSWAECRLLSLSILKETTRIVCETQSLWNRRILVPLDLLPQEARVK